MSKSKKLTFVDTLKLRNMDISLEKEEITRRFQSIYDIDLIESIKKLLDMGKDAPASDEKALQASINRAIDDSKNGKLRPYEEFIAEVRKKYLV